MPVPSNIPPIAFDDAVTFKEDETEQIAIIGNDTDPDGSIFAGTIEFIVQPEFGTIELGDDKKVAYTPNPNFIGNDSFIYILRDAEGDISEPVFVDITITEDFDDRDPNDHTQDNRDDDKGYIDWDDPFYTQHEQHSFSFVFEGTNDEGPNTSWSRPSTKVFDGLSHEQIGEMLEVEQFDTLGDQRTLHRVQVEMTVTYSLDGAVQDIEEYNADGSRIPTYTRLNPTHLEQVDLQHLIWNNPEMGISSTLRLFADQPTTGDLTTHKASVTDKALAREAVSNVELTDSGELYTKGVFYAGDIQNFQGTGNITLEYDIEAFLKVSYPTAQYQVITDTPGDAPILTALERGNPLDPHGVRDPDTGLWQPHDYFEFYSNWNTEITVTYAYTGSAGPSVQDDDVLKDNITHAQTPLMIDVLANDGPSKTAYIDPSTVTLNIAPAGGSVSIAGDGIVTYIPNAGFKGEDSFEYYVRDLNGDRSKPATVKVLVADNGPTLAADGDASNNFLLGTDQENLLQSFAGEDTIWALEGDDTLIGGEGNDTLDGGDGLDTASYDTSASNFLLSANTVEFIGVGGSSVDTILNVESLQFTDVRLFWGGTDWVASTDITPGVPSYGTPVADAYVGTSGADKMYGYGGNDTLLGESGEDAIFGGTGSDVITGGEGNDQLGGDNGDDSIHGNNGNDTLYGGSGRDTLKGNEGDDYIVGHYDKDVIFGGGGNDQLHGREGSDTIYGGKGNDKLYGDSSSDLFGGNDQLFGEDGNDVLHGKNGIDRLDGGAGDDNLTGGGGNDTFTFSDLTHSTDSARDYIADFTQSEDIIDLTAFSFTGIQSGAASGTTLGYTHSGGKTIVEAEGSDFAFELAGTITLDNGDFVFV